MSGHARRVSLFACAVSLVLVLSPFVGEALANGDPASDFLYTQWVFLPSDAGIPSSEQATLAALVNEARRAHFQIKVAVIASSYDLGDVPSSGESRKRTRAF